MSVQKDFIITEKTVFPSRSCLLWLKSADGKALPECLPGQFVQVEAKCQGVFLRRPISICDIKDDRIALFIKPVGKGSEYLTSRNPGDSLNMILPLGHGFDTGISGNAQVLLVGGGVGAAPLVMLSKVISEKGASVDVAIGGRTITDVERLQNLYDRTADVHFSTDDGTYGEKGLITQNSVFERHFDRIYCCGPTPMMRAVAKIAGLKGVWCELSLENHMACGLGACLCCVQETNDSGNVCVCTEGPVFNINRLESWI